jgi:hypothetical protein
MSRVELAPEVGDDFERIFDHLAQYDAFALRGRHQTVETSHSMRPHGADAHESEICRDAYHEVDAVRQDLE